MYEQTYDIIDWKSCASYTERVSNKNDISRKADDDGRLLPKASGGSNNSDIIFPTLFYEDRETETSIVTLPDYGSECWPSGTHDGVPDDMEQMTVYQKVTNWVSTQKVFFRKEEEPMIEDDDLEVINPVDLFHESILDEYLLVTEDDLERRVILRDLKNHRYDIESVEELMQTYEYKFIREPNGDVELELQHIVEFGNTKAEEKNTPRKSGKSEKSGKRKMSVCSSLDAEGIEERILFLGVPRLLENYVILNREGYVIELDDITDLWLAPFEENNLNRASGTEEDNQSELEFLSSWFSDVYQTDIQSAERRQTLLSDMLEKLTVISVGSDDEEIWLDAPEIPHWLHEEPEELELFNQPSRPLYYYRDRIKGCYRIIGVEDETVVLFSGNDDDTIFYTEENSFKPICTLNDAEQRDDVSEKGVITKRMRAKAISYDPRPSFVSKYRRIYNRLRYGKKDEEEEEEELSDAKNDSGIDEDIDEIVCEQVDVLPFPLSTEEDDGCIEEMTSVKRPSFVINPMKESFAECLFVVMGACIVLITLVLFKNGSPLFQMYRSKITEEVFNDIYLILSRVFK